MTIDYCSCIHVVTEILFFCAPFFNETCYKTFIVQGFNAIHPIDNFWLVRYTQSRWVMSNRSWFLALSSIHIEKTLTNLFYSVLLRILYIRLQQYIPIKLLRIDELLKVLKLLINILINSALHGLCLMSVFL